MCNWVNEIHVVFLSKIFINNYLSILHQVTLQSIIKSGVCLFLVLSLFLSLNIIDRCEVA